jgi:hypothetical protein
VNHSQREMPKTAVNLEKAGLPVSAPYSQYLLTDFMNEQGAFPADSDKAESVDRKILTLITN